MNSLPTELNLNILHHVRDSIPNALFTSNDDTAIAHGEGYNAFLLRVARYHRHWTASAQSELFHHIILHDGDKTRLLLKLLSKTENDHPRTYAQTTSSIIVGHSNGFNQDYDNLNEHLDELAQYCPNIVEISCASVNTKFSDFQNFQRLDRLNFLRGHQDGSGLFSLSITQLSLKYYHLPTPLDPASFPFLRHAFCHNLSDFSLQSVLPLLPQITYLRIGDTCTSRQINSMVSASASLTKISFSDSNIRNLDDQTLDSIKGGLEVVILELDRYSSGLSKVAECITGSKMLKKVVLDGSRGSRNIHPSQRPGRSSEMKKLVDACKKRKTVELWKENFLVNGKVDLDADVATTFDLA